MIKYRPDVDGLRAIAVLSVIIYHAKITLNESFILPGGYLGVDVSKETYRIYLNGLFKIDNNKSNVIDISTSYDVIKERFSSSYKILDNVKHKNIKRVYPEKILCNSYVQNRCATNDGKTLFYYDDDHLSIPGAELILNSLMSEIKN
tara:strand:+ start:1966 stop:2406 length:441 start_codon:yes stop_codon:yes gene_type:complete